MKPAIRIASRFLERSKNANNKNANKQWSKADVAKKTRKKTNAPKAQPSAPQSTLNGHAAKKTAAYSNSNGARAVASKAIGSVAETSDEKSWGEHDPRYWQWALAVLVLGIALRQVLLANFPYHPDEAIHAWYATPDVFSTYRYDPIYHGPVMYHLTAGTFTFFTGLFRILHLDLPGANDYTARLVPSLLGIGVLLTILYGPMRRWIGPRGALWALALVAISPVIVTYSRRLLHDSLVLLLTLSAVICFQTARENPAWTQRGRNAWLGIVVALTLFVSTKANAYFIMAMLGAFWAATLWPSWKSRASVPTPQERDSRVRREDLARDHWSLDTVLQWVPLALFIFIAIASYYALRDVNIEYNERLFRYACLLSVGLLWLWLHSGPRHQLRSDAEPDEAEKTPAQRRTSSWRTVALSGWAAVGIFAFFYGHGWLWWKVIYQFDPITNVPAANAPALRKGERYPKRLATFNEYRNQLKQIKNQYDNSLDEIKGFATFQSKAPPPLPNQTWLDNRLNFAHDWDDVTMAIPRGLGYWGKQQKEPRLPGRHDYYLVLMTLYEAPIVLAAIGGIVLASRRRSPFTDLLLWWAFTSFVLYALANEKVPWLLNHIMLPFCLLGGWWLSQLRPQSTLMQRAMTVGCAASAIFLLRGVSATNFERAVENREPMFYAQTTEDFRDALFAGLENSQGIKDPIWVHDHKQWPPAWYLRNGAPMRGASGVGFGTAPGPEEHRLLVMNEPDWPIRQKEPRFADWKGTTVYHYIWPRASWPALRPDRFWRWWAKRDALTKAEEKMMKDGLKTLDTLEDTILKTPGEWSHSTAVFASPP